MGQIISTTYVSYHLHVLYYTLNVPIITSIYDKLLYYMVTLQSGMKDCTITSRFRRITK